eukprot:11969532-Alexandrium_andersonii.AAC.1
MLLKGRRFETPPVALRAWSLARLMLLRRCRFEAPRRRRRAKFGVGCEGALTTEGSSAPGRQTGLPAPAAAGG